MTGVKQKRKNDSNIETKEPLSKHIKTEDIKKVPLHNMKKLELIKYCKELEEMCEKLQYQNDKLEREKVDNIDALKHLEEATEVLELKNKMLQDQEDRFKYTCRDCDFESECVHCFSDHDHDIDDEQKMQPPNFNCYYCDEIFPTKATVMIHTKASHMTKAKPCLSFLEGTCNYNDKCWFLHDEGLKQSDPTFKCNYCDESFRTKTQMMQHKKWNHTDKVSKCKNEKNSCRYGTEKCWFLHSANIEQAYKNAKNVIVNENETYSKNDTGNLT